MSCRFWEQLFYYLTLFANIPGLVLTSFTFFCMAQVVNGKKETLSSSSSWSMVNSNRTSNMFKYLLIKAAFETMINLLGVISLPFVFWDKAYTRFTGIMITYFYQTNFAAYNIPPVLSMFMFGSSLMEIAATMDCLLSVSNKLNWLQSKTSFYLITLGIITFSVLINCGDIIMRAMVQRFDESSNQTYYVYEYFNNGTLNGDHEAFERYRYISYVLQTLQSVLRDLIFMLVIITLNVLILLQMIQASKRKLKLTNARILAEKIDIIKANQNKSQHNKTMQRFRDERRKCFVIILIGLAYFLGHVSYLFFQFQRNFFASRQWLLDFPDYWYLGQYISTFLLLLDYQISFYFYYFFNTHFRKYANQNLRYIVYPIEYLSDRSSSKSYDTKVSNFSYTK